MWLLASEIGSIDAKTGLAIAITGMLIVFSALILISLALTVLPKVLAIVNEYYPEKADHSAPPPRASSAVADHEFAAAAAYAIHIHRRGSS
jgi:Na+-transporting methylmalonyl-CoA/oxaloacetate decarboxylase gamma subunit